MVQIDCISHATLFISMQQSLGLHSYGIAFNCDQIYIVAILS